MGGADGLIIFILRGGRFALSLREVAEVMEPPRFFPLPNAPSFFPGLVNFHGNLVSLLDLGQFLLGLPRQEEGKVLVLDSAICHLALWVDGVESVGASDVILGVKESDEPLVEKVLETARGEVKMLAVEALLQQLEGILTVQGSGAEI